MVYKNALGMPDANVSILVFEDVITKKKSYILRSSSDYHSSIREWPYETPVSEIVAHMDADGFDCYIRTGESGLCSIHCIHRETHRFMQEQKRADDKKFKDAERGFVRYGYMPGGRKKIAPNAGVSCIHAEFLPSGEYRLVNLTPELQRALVGVIDKPAYRVYGEVVWIGNDGEPVLKVDRFEPIKS